MNQEFTQTQSTQSFKEKVIKFYKSNKILIISISTIVLISFFSIVGYVEFKEKKNLLLSESYIDAKIYINNGEKDKAKKILKKIIFSNNKTYAVLSFFLLMNENLIKDQQEVDDLFNHLLKDGNFDKEVENLIIFKKALFKSNYSDEIELLDTLKPLINGDSVWKPHALFLLGDYFVYKKEFLKAKEFYLQILTLKNLHKEFYEEAQLQLSFIENE